MQEEKSKEKAGYSFVPTGPGQGSGSGVYFIDSSDDYKRCLKMAREKLEKEEKLTILEKEEMNWVKSLKETREKTLTEKLLQLKVGEFLHFCQDILSDQVRVIQPVHSTSNCLLWEFDD